MKPDPPVTRTVLIAAYCRSYPRLYGYCPSWCPLVSHQRRMQAGLHSRIARTRARARATPERVRSPLHKIIVNKSFVGHVTDSLGTSPPDSLAAALRGPIANSRRSRRTNPSRISRDARLEAD